MKERIIIVFVAIAIGLIVTTLVFFLYQQTKSIPDNTTLPDSSNNNTLTQTTDGYLVIESPAHEALSDARTVQVKGKTDAGNVVIVSTNQEDVIAKTTNDGSFTVSISIDTGSNRIITRSIAPDGTTTEDIRIITYNTEEF